MPLLVRAFRSLLVLSLVGLIAGVGGLVVVKRLRAGTWMMPDRGDLHWVASFLGPEAEPSRVIYLNPEPVAVIGGFDYAPTNRSSIVPLGGRVELPGFRGSARTWDQVMACVRQQFAAFDVVVTDQRPRGSGYVMVAVGGRPEDLGIARGHISGVAPFNGRVIADAIVFAFAEQVGNRPRALCETIAHEVAHTYGLDHTHRCSDLMTHLTGCGSKRFVDHAMPCGEANRRACEGGQPVQNSYRRLFDVLGPRPAPRLPTS